MTERRRPQVTVIGAAWAGKRLDNSRETAVIPVDSAAGLDDALRRILAAFFR